MNLTIDPRLRRRFKALPVDWPRRLLLGALVLILIVQLVRLLFALISPATPLGDWQPKMPQDMAPTARAELFGRVDPFYRSMQTASESTSQVTGLQIQLFGIRMNYGTDLGSAIIAGADGIQNSIGVGEDIQPGVKLVAVRFDHVEIDNAGKRELLYLDQAQGAAVAAGTAPGPTLSAPMQPNAEISGTIPISPMSIRAGISFSPRSEGGRVTGIAVGQQGDGSAFQAAGFRNGDVIRSINGRPVNAAGDAASLLSQVQPGARLSLEVERGAGTVPIAIIIPNGNP
jgi:general secretion pathway protein C